MERRQVTAAGEAPPRQQQQQQLLPPGFRFHPTDVELIVQYLRRMVLARPLPAAVIPVVRTSASLPDPWDLPGASEGEAAYFFSQRQAPASGGIGRRRRAGSGYWKATGKETPVFVQLQGPSGNAKRLLVGVKTTLAFHRGKGKASLTRTDWVMHEYRLATAPGAGAADKKMTGADELQSRGDHQAPTGEWVVCRVALRNRARRQALAAGETDDHTPAAVHRAAGDHPQPSASPSSSCVTDTCHASDHQEEVSSTY
uniref:Uncharacterized protein n=1 Tax=Avena sativa TaxID=4498 RepID=A0ACD5YDW4_AVESA